MADTPLIDIRPDHWAIVQGILRQHVPQYEVWAFGSRAKWTAKDYSDLDLAVITNKPMPLAVSTALADDFSESDLPWRVDVADWATTNESFRKIIARDKVVVQQAAPGRGMAGEWRETTLGEAFLVNPSRSIRKGQVTPFVPMDVLPENGRTPNKIAEREFTGSGMKFRNGDTLIARITPCLENGKTVYVNILPDDAIAHGSTEYIVLSGRSNHTDNLFAYYVARSPEFRSYAIGHMEGTSGRQRVPSSAVEKFTLTLPPLSEQRAIAHILGSLDDRIDNLRQTNATLEAIAQALFKSWFVDFDGVPPEDMQESELGLIPMGWRVGALADLCNLNASKWADKKHPPTVRYIDLSGVSCNRIEAVNEFVFSKAPSRARLHLREGDTIVGTVRPGNRAFAYIHAPDVNLTGSTGFAVLSPKQPHYASFIYLAATRDKAIDRLVNLADGAAYPAVRPNVVAETPCAVAPEGVLAKFSDVTKPLLEHITQNSQQTVTLAALRDTLLPRLLSGKLRVKNVERIAEGVR